MSKEKKMMGKNRPKTKNVLFFKGDGGVGTFDVGGRGPGVCPSIRFLDPPLLSILYMTIYFSANLLLFIFLLFRVRLG